MKMSTRQFLFVSFCATSLFAANACLAESPTPTFVMPKDFAPLDMLPMPPAANSQTEKTELGVLHTIEAARTPAEAARAQADEDERDIFIFKSVMGDGFSAQALPLTAKLSKHVEGDMLADAEPVKDLLQRVRPYNVDKTLHPVCKLKTKPDSYPSGHTMTGYMMALTLAAMIPEKRDAIFLRAADYAHNRLVCGVHHPSDLEAGKEVAYALFGMMQDNPQFKAERAAAEAEIRKALNLPARASEADHAAAK